MKHHDQGCFELGNEEFELLVWSVPNEVINGFEVTDFENVIGASQEQVKAIANGLRSAPENTNKLIDRGQAQILRNALALVLQELGIEEFQTRTGCDFQEGQKILRQLDDLVSKTESKATKR